MRRGLGFLLTGVLALLAAGRVAAADWQVAQHENGLTIYTRSVEGQDLKDFRGIVRVKAPLQRVLQALVDVEAMPSWFFNMTEARLLDSNGPAQSHIYFVIKGMWPVSDRDGVLRLQIRQDERTLAVTLDGRAAPEHYPPMRTRVRIPRLQAGWTVTPVAPDETEIRLDGQADPGGSIPVWMANMVVVELPEVTLKNLRQQLEDPTAPVRDPATDPRINKLLKGIKYPE
ncbi:MAG TPA: START domain-containing protein [Moraxellaceae bacterium]